MEQWETVAMDMEEAVGIEVEEHNDGDDMCSYLEILVAINARGLEPARDRVRLFRRIAFNILISNTDDYFRNHGFLWSGKKG